MVTMIEYKPMIPVPTMIDASFVNLISFLGHVGRKLQLIVLLTLPCFPLNTQATRAPGVSLRLRMRVVSLGL
jgi:hypothetical protein